MAEPRPAATVVLLRERAGRPEVLLLRRHGRAGFLPNAWVFPGGVVDEDDARVRCTGTLRGLGPEARPFAVAAVRECLEEAGIWLGRGRPPAGLRAALQEGRARLSEVPGLSVDLDRLHPWARWVTPVEERRRYDTLFFVAVAASAARSDHRETTAALWIEPAAALERAGLDDLFVVPPTWRVLEELAALGSVDAVLRAAPGRRLDPILPVRERYPGALFSVLLPGHPDYPDPSVPAAPGPRRIALVEGRWRSLD